LADGDEGRFGPAVPGWSGAPAPEPVVLPGRYVMLEPLDPVRHGAALQAQLHDPRDPVLWDYLPDGPFPDGGAAWEHWLATIRASPERLAFALIDVRDGVPKGLGSYLRIDPANGSIEIGNLAYGAGIQRSPATTETTYLFARHAFDDLGYRRLEWKCNARNARSMAAAQRLGFTFEGIFRQAQVVKGHNRDTAWFSILDREWPPLRAGFEAWLDPANFDQDGRQRRSLGDFVSRHD
jgi:RimJ/RimL family protein N-acetyltransferase